MCIVEFLNRFPNKSEQYYSFFLISSLSSCQASQHYSLRNSEHAVVSVHISFLSSIRQESPLYQTTFRYQLTDWDSLGDFLRDASWIDILNLSFENCASNIST